jgi:hypothetical protein
LLLLLKALNRAFGIAAKNAVIPVLQKPAILQDLLHLLNQFPLNGSKTAGRVLEEYSRHVESPVRSCSMKPPARFE